MSISMRKIELWLLKFLCFAGGCFFCFYLQASWGVGAVVAASLTGLIGTFFPDTKKIEGVHIHSTIYMGAFVAMGSKIVSAGPGHLLLVSLLGSTIYFFAIPYFKGFGGKLGLIAFISSLLGFALRYCLL